jgi:hypothetical protein
LLALNALLALLSARRKDKRRAQGQRERKNQCNYLSHHYVSFFYSIGFMHKGKKSRFGNSFFVYIVSRLRALVNPRQTTIRVIRFFTPNFQKNRNIRKQGIEK